MFCRRLEAPGEADLDGFQVRSMKASATITVPAGEPLALSGLLMLATFLKVLDATIANVVLPHMQGPLGATRESVSWVLTSYIVASAAELPITRLALGKDRTARAVPGIGRGFHDHLGDVRSSSIGAANGCLSPYARLTGAFLVPISQTVLLDINPPQHHVRASAIWEFGVSIGPVVGPAIGGWLTGNFDWG